MTKKKAQYVGSSEINGQSVAFFSPPHDESDFLWVDLEQLTRAFVSEETAIQLVKTSHQLGRLKRPTATAHHNGRILTIVCHPIALGVCGVIDHKQGYVSASDSDWNNGPAALAYIKTLAEAQETFAPLSFEQMFAASANEGGPFMRGFK